MFDINFYMKVFDLKKKIIQGLITDKKTIMARLEECSSKEPIVYNIETTNACNMRCEMCPRTTLMTRPVATMDMGVFKKIIQQIEPFTENKWHKWEVFVEKKYKIKKNKMSENNFFLYVIPKVLVLHGYGDPLLDKHMAERIKLLAKKNIPSYFSCNPANIDIDKSIEMFDNGLDYIKYSIESIDDARHKAIRGNKSNFTHSYKKILKLLDMKQKNKYRVTIVITMLDLHNPQQEDEFQRLKDVFRGCDVYIYLKSQDQKWYKDARQQTKSIHWREFCQFPWSSMTIKSNGEAVECVEDYDNEIVLGDARRVSLYDIWNGEEYRKLRENHFTLKKKIKCTERCDMPLIGRLV